MMIDRWTDRTRLSIGNFDHPDDPRGRTLSVSIDLGIPSGQFDSSLTGPAEYGDWGFGITLWRWGFSFYHRGPIVGNYPPSEDD